MSVRPSKLLSFLLLSVILGLASPSVQAQDEKSEAKKSEAVEKVVREQFKKIKKLAADGKWKKLGSAMTKEAADEFCSRQVISAMGLQKILDQLPMSVESLEDAADAVTDVFDEYKIDTDKFDISSVMKIGGQQASSDKDEKKAKKAAKELNSSIVKRLDKNGKRWEIVGKLFKAQAGSMFAINPINGEIKKVIVKKDAVLAKVVPAPPKQEGGVQIRIMTPPVYIRFEKREKKGWLFCGTDQKETEKARKEFMKNQGNPGNAEEDEDIF